MVQTFKYSDLLNRLEGFDDWLRGLGLRPHRNDRIHLAIDALRAADASTRKGRETGEYSKVQAEDLFPLIEALEAHDVFIAFEHDLSLELAAALRRALSGPTQPIDENERNRDGRNIWFELALAAEWKSRGALVRLGEPDLQLFIEDKKFLVACKRPASEHSVRSNIRAAISQLNDNLESESQDVFGVVAISLSRVLNPGSKYWSGELQQLGDYLQQLMPQYSRYWKSADADPRICSILLHIATPSDIGKNVDVALATYIVAGTLNEHPVGTRMFEKQILKIKAQYQ